MRAVTAPHAMTRPSLDGRGPDRPPAERSAPSLRTCGGAPVLDLALCLILAVAVVGLLMIAV